MLLMQQCRFCRVLSPKTGLISRINSMEMDRQYHFWGRKIVLGHIFAGMMVGLSLNAHAEDFTQALVSAYMKNPRLMAERARVREADENYVQAQAQGRFTVNANATIGRERREGGSFFNQDPSVQTPKTAQLSIVKPLYQGGRVRGLKAQAKAGINSARQSLRNAEQNVLLAAATAYLDVIRDEEATKIRRNNVRVLTQQGFAAQDRFDVGEGTRTDIAQSRARLASAESGLAQAEAQLATSRASFVRYMGHMPEQLQSPPTFELPATLREAQLLARANNPQMIASRYNENAAQAAVFVAKSAGRPTVALQSVFQGTRDSANGISRSDSMSIVAQLRVPLYQGGLNQSRVRAAKHAVTRARFESRDIEIAIDQAIANLWAQIDSAKLSLKASEKQVEAAEIAFEGVKLEQEVGTRNTLDVLNAEQELLNARLSVVDAQRALNVATMQMLVTMGAFDAYALQLPVNMYDPEQNFNQVTKDPFMYYVPDFIEKPAEKVIDKSKGAVGFTVGKVGKDT
ncbi:MAG TPA: hypothetical protein ENJ46_03995, partial [Hellea balneolensis]|nr:hypothetical protein [Hellea balneolensis]